MNVTVQRCERTAHPNDSHLHTERPESQHPLWLPMHSVARSEALREGRVLPGVFGTRQVGEEIAIPPEIEHLNQPVVQECTNQMHPNLPHRHFTYPSGLVTHATNESYVLQQHYVDEGVVEEPGRFGKGESVSHGVTPPAEHGSRPEWPVEECTFGHVNPVHYHVTRDNWGDRDPMWNGTIHENGGYHTEQGRRFAKGEHLSHRVTVSITTEWSEAHE
jgi:hypothetical protein